MTDAIVTGGTVLLESVGLTQCDIGITDGRITEIAGNGALGSAGQKIDATGLIVLPGVIDAHVHFGLGSPEDWTTESRAAARGGITSVLNYLHEAPSYLEVGPRERAKAEAESVIDFGFHFILMNDLHLSEVGSYIEQEGVPSYKYFTNFKGDEGAYLGIEGTDTGFFYDLCRAIAAHPEAVLVVHTENIEIVWRLAGQLKAEGRDGLAAWTDSRPDFVEAHDMFTAFYLGARAGTRIYIPHLSSAAGLDLYEEHAARGGHAYIETCPHYLTHTKDSEIGSLAKVNPPLRTERDQDALWAAIAHGAIHVVGSDHNSRPRSRKEGSIWKASAGFPGVSTLLPVLISEGYHKRQISLDRLVSLVTSQPARIFGMYPQKGTIAVGSDADLTLLDLNAEKTVDSRTFGSHADYSIYDGWQLKGWPVATIVRGVEVMREGEILANAGHGRYLRRPLMSPSPALAGSLPHGD